MNNQEIFNKVWNGLKAQGFERSMAVVDEEDTLKKCAYRGENGRKCAAGHLIPDELYKKEFEGNGAYRLRLLWDTLGIKEKDISTISNLQQRHDDADSPAGMERSLRCFANKNNLSIPE